MGKQDLEMLANNVNEALDDFSEHAAKIRADARKANKFLKCCPFVRLTNVDVVPERILLQVADTIYFVCRGDELFLHVDNSPQSDYFEPDDSNKCIEVMEKAGLEVSAHVKAEVALKAVKRAKRKCKTDNTVNKKE